MPAPSTNRRDEPDERFQGGGLKDQWLKRQGQRLIVGFSKLGVVGVVIVMSLHVILLAYSAYIHSPTLNEPSHLVAGISYWKTGKFDIYSVNPPLVRLVAAIPPVLLGAKEDWSRFTLDEKIRPEFMLGEDFVVANGRQTFWLITCARWACIPFSFVGAWACYRWSSRLYGPTAGFVSCCLWCFCPSILGHGPLITSDVAGAAMAILAAYSFWEWLQTPTWRNAILSGIILGIAELTKSTLIVLVPLWPIAWFIYRWVGSQPMELQQWSSQFCMLIGRVFIMLVVLNAAYLFEGSFKPLGQYRFASESLAGKNPNEHSNRFAQSWMASIPVPLPENYVRGIDLQRRDFENWSVASYLNGTYQSKGWWYYYLYAAWIKLPCGTLLLIGMALVPVVRDREKDLGTPGFGRRDRVLVLFPSIIIFLLVSSQTGFSEHFRYAIPCLPFLYVWVGKLFLLDSQGVTWRMILASLSLCWSIASSVSIYPHSLSYFNEFVGGPQHGPKHLLSSNIDWGQDLILLEEWRRKHPECEPLNLAFSGVSPSALGMQTNWEVSNADGAVRTIPPPGWYAISVNCLYGLPRVAHYGNEIRIEKMGELNYFRDARMQQHVGYSVYLFKCDEIVHE